MANNLAVSDVARVSGLRTSAIRYYEQIGILPKPMRKNGQRRYDKSVLFRLAVVQRARESGFTLDEIRELFFGFRSATRPSKRWHVLSDRKIAELQIRMKRLKLMETLLKQMQGCRCDALEECGEKLLSQQPEQASSRTLRLGSRLTNSSPPTQLRDSVLSQSSRSSWPR